MPRDWRSRCGRASYPIYCIIALNRSDVRFLFVKKPGDNLASSPCRLAGSLMLNGSGIDTQGRVDATHELGLNACGAGLLRSF
jgi:hypothetical protein